VSPHFPLIAPPEFYRLYRPEDLPLPKPGPASGESEHPWLAAFRRCFIFDDFFTDETRRIAIASYYALVSFLDDNVGRVLAALEASGQAASTRVVYASDHGDNLGARGLWGKSTMFEESVGIPLIVAGPDMPRGKVSATPVSLIDVYPTVTRCLDLPELPDERELPGRSLFEIAGGPDDPERVVLAQYHAAGAATGAFMLRQGRYKYVHYVGMPPQLFDLAADPDELDDQALAPGSVPRLQDLERRLRGLVDPEAVDRRAKADQAALVEAFGGRDAVIHKGGFGATPAPGQKAQYMGHRPEGPSKLDAVREAREAQLDAARPAAIARHKEKGRLTARENIADFLDPDSFVEYGMLARPAREGMEGAADGLVAGTGMVEGFPAAVVAYDYTVHAGTQSAVNHMKIDHMFDLAIRQRLPTVCWLEGGGARPHDLNVGLRGATQTFVAFAKLSGLAPTVGIVAGRAFAGNANLAGLCDVLIATPQAVLGMAGPPLVEAALGKKFTPEEIGAVDVHLRSGVIDLVAPDERAANRLARQYLGYFRGLLGSWEAPDVAGLRDLVPENPRRAYDVRRVIEHLADLETVLELKSQYGKALVTALARIEGFPVGFIADQPMVLGGAIDAPAAEKGARFIDLCDAYDVPMIFLCDTPGLMVGPETEATGLVRRSARLLTKLTHATTPFMTVVLRKAYGLGYYVMGSRPLEPVLLLAWPTAEFGGMGLEGAVNIIYRRELEAIEDPQARAAFHRERTDALKRANTALSAAGRFDVDDVIDPADTRRLLAQTLARLPLPPARVGRKHPVDPF
jgi:acetyl-CoA carboxylase carboxyltransferase component